MSSNRHTQQLEDVPELMQLIQLRLPVKEAARTSVLSKSWLHAWSTISTLRLHYKMKLDAMERILTRYLRDNIPIERFELDIVPDTQEPASVAEKCIWTMATHKNSTTLRELSLTCGPVYGIHIRTHPVISLPHEILSCKNLTKITVLSTIHVSMTSHDHDHPVVINCVSLRELYLKDVYISQELLDGILFSCRLLVKIVLIYPSQCLNTIKVKNLPCLYELKIKILPGSSTVLEIDHVPNLRVFTWRRSSLVPYTAHSISLGSSLKELWLGNMVTYDASLDMTKYEAPLLESVTLDMANWELGSFHLTCASIKRLALLSSPPTLNDVKGYAPNLVFFRLEGRDIMPSLLFPVSTLIKQTTFRLHLNMSAVDLNFFLRMREALAMLSSSNCDVHITTEHYGNPPLDIDFDELRTRLPFPHTAAMNVQRLSFKTNGDDCSWKRSHFFDAFFEICHPNHITAMEEQRCKLYIYKNLYEFDDILDPCHYDEVSRVLPINHFCKVMLTEVILEKKNERRRKKKKKNSTTAPCWPRYLKHVQINRNAKWETLTNSHKSFLKAPPTPVVDFKLEWH